MIDDMNDFMIEYHYNLDDTWTWKLLRGKDTIAEANAPTLEAAVGTAHQIRAEAVSTLPAIRKLTRSILSP